MNANSNGRNRKPPRRAEKREERPQPLKRVPISSPHGARRGPIEFIEVKDVFYFYNREAVRRGLISGHDVGAYAYRSGVYLRTAHGVYRSTFRSLRSLMERLPAGCAVRANHGIAVNPDRISKLELWAKKKEAIFRVDGRTAYADADWIWLSRTGARALISLLGVQGR
jgi:hypothetical protein